MGTPRRSTQTARENRAAKRAELREQGRIAELNGVDPDSRMGKFLDGEITVEDLDWQELLRGQLRDRNGTFTGRPRLMVPRKFHQAISRELLSRVDQEFREDFDASMTALRELIQSPRTPAREKLAAIIYWQERTIGRVADKSTVEVEVKRFDRLVEGGTLLVDLDEPEAPALPAEEIFDAEVVNDL